MDTTPEQVGMPLQSQHAEAGAARAEIPPPPAIVSEAGAAGMGSVDQIRDIIFGGQMRDYDKRFASLEERLGREVAALRDDTNRRFDALQAFMRQELDNLGQRLSHEQETRAQTMQTQGHELRQQLAEQGQQLTSEIVRRFDDLSASLDRQASSLRHEKTDRATLATLLTEVAQRLAADPHHGG